MGRTGKRIKKRTRRKTVKRKAIRRRSVSKEKGTVKKISKKKLEVYKKLLLKEKERLTDEIQHIARETLNKSQKEASGDISGYTYHMADVATDSYDREFSLSIAGSEGDILYDINEALKRIEDGSYGRCLECDKPISTKRLKAVPHTKYCIKCQSMLETDKK